MSKYDATNAAVGGLEWWGDIIPLIIRGTNRLADGDVTRTDAA